MSNITNARITGASFPCRPDHPHLEDRSRIQLAVRRADTDRVEYVTVPVVPRQIRKLSSLVGLELELLLDADGEIVSARTTPNGITLATEGLPS